MNKIRNALPNTMWGIGYVARGEKNLIIGLLISLPFLHWPILDGNWTLYPSYPFILALIGYLIPTIVFVIDAYIRPSPNNY